MKRQDQIIRKMQEIETMETGKLCLMRRSAAGKAYYNLQSWTDGRNVSRYVPAAELEDTRKAVANHEQFMALVEEYVDLIVEKTRTSTGKRRKSAKS